MLINLSIKNFALIKEANIDFEDGFNIISGETGAGKSILLNAIALLKGGRFNKNFLGNFSDETLIEAIFSSNEKIDSILVENGIQVNENLIIHRRFTEKSSVTKINNQAVNLSILGQISDILFDIHGQHSQLIILNKANYVNIIDSFDASILNLKTDISKNLRDIRLLEKDYESFDMSEDEILRQRDILTYQIEEIEEFDFDSYDEEAFNSEYKKLSNQTEILEGINKSLYIINDGKNQSLKDMLNYLDELLSDISDFDKSLEDYSSKLIGIKEEVYDLARELEHYSYSLDVDEDRILEIERIFQTLQNLKRKYGKNIDDIVAFYEDARKKLFRLKNIENEKQTIYNSIEKLKRENFKLAEAIHSKRLAVIKRLEGDITSELNEMNMNYILFKIELSKLDKVGEDGFDSVDFLISTNKGQELKSLSQVSSGGEISRFMLALKAVLADNDKVETLIFDEIDTGISGKTANIVGQKLKKISNVRQLLVITHLPQIASQANTHFLISKKEVESKTLSSISKLDYDDRVREIARLISGQDITDLTISSAEELLKFNAKRKK
ncbi:DNA repair protein RecN [Peptoniphilaceae bacterium SGI.131]